MPRGDRTGPLGMGPMTGRAAGYCAGNPVPGYMNPFGGRGMGLGRGFRGGGGRGYGRGFGYNAPVAPYVNPAYAGYYPAGVSAPPYVGPEAPGYSSGQELEMLKNQAGSLESTLEDIKKRIGELEASATEEKEKK